MQIYIIFEVSSVLSFLITMRAYQIKQNKEEREGVKGDPRKTERVVKLTSLDPRDDECSREKQQDSIN